jgi:hypothetical protein
MLSLPFPGVGIVVDEVDEVSSTGKEAYFSTLLSQNETMNNNAMDVATNSRISGNLRCRIPLDDNLL